MKKFKHYEEHLNTMKSFEYYEEGWTLRRGVNTMKRFEHYEDNFKRKHKFEKLVSKIIVKISR